MAPEIMTRSGHYFNFAEPENNHICINDIAHALSNICRFTGHVSEFYSVAQHSVYVSYLAPEKYALCGLLHDAAEAYLGDVATPLKNMLQDYKQIEKRIEAKVMGHFGVEYPLPQCVKTADTLALFLEQRDLLDNRGASWEVFKSIRKSVCSRVQRIKPMSPTDAREFFLNRYKELTSV